MLNGYLFKRKVKSLEASDMLIAVDYESGSCCWMRTVSESREFETR
jgi:hypothetical protein